jgi:exopolyphosphatase/guanosine-5'-triphosphate,3'-diphosphate pyrophosphatase
MNKKTIAGLSGYVTDGRLSEAGIAKAATILKRFKGIMTNFNIENYSVFATASLRNVSNTQEALVRIEEATGIKVDLISGEEEARLGFVGAMHAVRADEGLFIDIGGGSTELLCFENQEIQQALSLPVGSLNLFIRHVNALVPTNKEIQDIKKSVVFELEKSGILTQAPAPHYCRNRRNGAHGAQAL